MAKTKTYRFCGKDLVLGKTVALKKGKNPPTACLEQCGAEFMLTLSLPGLPEVVDIFAKTPRGCIGHANRWLLELSTLTRELWSRA